MGIGVNVQLGTITSADVPDLRRFNAALLICDWPERLPDTLAVLDAAGVGVGIWRFTENPVSWPGWPGDFIQRCNLAVFWNEPDIEGPPPSWAFVAEDAWRAAGGLVAEGAWSDETRRKDYGRHYDVLTCHCYANQFENLISARMRA